MRKFVLLIMIVLSAGALALAQNKRISGTVKGVDGKPIAGATVLVEGTSIGTTTNAEGRFSVQAPADGTLVDASYFSIKNITLGYTLPRRWTSKIGFKAARVSASVDNLCIFTHLKGMDPQYSLTGGTSYAYAPTRTVSFNLDLKF